MAAVQPLLDAFLRRILAGGLALLPERVLCVGQSWPAGADPARYFTTPQAAMAQAATMAPTSASPVLIWCAPGTYGGAPIAHVSDVYVAGLGGDPSEVILSCGVAWTPGAGPNVVKAAVAERAAYSNLTLRDVTVVATGKTGSTSQLGLYTVDRPVGAATAHTGRAGGPPPDSLVFLAVDHQAATISFTDTNFEADAATTLAMTAPGLVMLGGSVFSIRGTAIRGDVAAAGTTSGTLVGVEATGPGNLTNSGSGFVRAVGCAFAGALTQVNLNGTIDARCSTYGALAGPGPINRSIDRFTFTNGGGLEAIAFAGVGLVDYPDANYSVAFVVSNPPAYPGPFVVPDGSRLPTGFTINDASGGGADVSFVISHP